MVALIVVQTKAARTNLRTSDVRCKEFGKASDDRRYPADTASSELPIAIPTAVTPDTGVSRLASRAPASIPGQIRYPSNSTAAIATPVGGQTGDTFV